MQSEVLGRAVSTSPYSTIYPLMIFGRDDKAGFKSHRNLDLQCDEFRGSMHSSHFYMWKEGFPRERVSDADPLVCT